MSGSVAISGGTVKAYGGATYKASLGIYSKNNINISGTADVTATGGTATDDGSFGINAEGAVIISGGEVKATGGTGKGSDGLYSGNGDIKISGGKVTAIGGTVTVGWSVGIYANTSNSNLQISDTADVTAIGGSTHDTSCGIYSPKNVTISGGTLTAIGGSASVRSYGINSTNNVTFAGGTLTAATKGDDCINGTLNVTGSGVKTISFDRNGGSGNMKAYTNADSYTLPANSFVAPSDKKFKCWSVDDTEKAAGNDIDVDADTTVKAVWDDITYTITFDANGGSVTPASAVTDTDGKLTSLPTPTRSRYSFNGWYTEASGGTKVDTDYVFNANTTIYAHWTYTGGGGGGSKVTTNTVTADSVKNGDVAISPKYAAKGTIVTLKIEPDKGYKLDTVTVTDKNGNKIELTDKGNGEYTFKMPATKVNVETTFVEETITEDNTMMNFFVDIPDDAYYYDAVLWAAKNGITGGMDDTHFAPDITCTRVQAITFLWRAAGSPMPKSSEISFEDIETDSYYYYAVLWALENGITSGTSATTFSPDDTCSRGQIVTFLWRSAKSPTVGMDNTFTDVSSDSYYADATNWAVANGITNGTSDTTFSPDENCTRGQIVTLLYRFFVK